MDNTAFAFGLNFGNAPDAVNDVDPSGGSYAGSHYLDVLYIADENPGQWTSRNGWPTLNDLKWFRLPCVDAVTMPDLVLSSHEVGYPSWSKHGQDTTMPVVVENQGNEDLIISSIVGIEDVGPSGWLAVDLAGFGTTIPFGINSSDTFRVTINESGIVNSPGTPVALTGRVEIVSNDDGSPTYFEIVNWLIADTLRGLEFFAIGTGCINIALGNNGDMGYQGGDGNAEAVTGQFNMDFWNCDECDTFVDSLPGDASVYLYDASPVVLRGTVSGVDTSVVASYSIFGNDFVSPVGFRPVPDGTNDSVFAGANFVAFGSGTFVTVDSAIGLEQWTYAPVDGANISYLVQCVKVYSWDGDPHDSLVIGQAIDWDIPSDSGSINLSGIDFANDMVWVQGLETTAADECQPNNNRFGAAAMIGWTTYLDQGVFHDQSSYHNIYTASNEDFLSDATISFDVKDLYGAMVGSVGLGAHDQSADLHQIITFSADFDLNAFDTLYLYYVYGTVRDGSSTDLATVIDNGRQWFTDNQSLLVGPPVIEACCGLYDPENLTGNVDYSPDGYKDISDILYLARAVFLGGTPLVCPAEGNVSGDEPCLVDVDDILRLARYSLLGGIAPAPCDPACEL
jgi:hypothetical protein